MYLPRGPCRNSFSAALYDFVVSTANSVMKPATILSSQKSTARVNLLFTCCNCSICTGVQSSCRIWFVTWLSFNLSIHSCSRCGKSQKKTSCKSVNTYLSRYLRGVILGFLLSFCANSSSLVLNQPSISSFVGFQVSTFPSSGSFLSSFLHSLRAQSISSTQSFLVPINATTKPFVGYLLLTLLS
jgi:hypothetical protein